MISKAEKSDLVQLKEIYNVHKSGEFVRYWFNEEYDPFDTYVVKEENRILSTITAKKGTLSLKQKRLSYSFLKHFYRFSNDKDLEMIREIVDELSYQDLLILTKANKPDLFLKAGFEPVYFKRDYVISRSQIESTSNQGIVETYEDKELLKLYQQYTSFFEGYPIRDFSYYLKQQELKTIMNYRTIVYKNQHLQPLGYMVFDLKTYPIKVKEIIYLDSIALIKMLNYALSYKDSVQFSLTEEEQIIRIIPTAIYNSGETIYGKITDYALFNRLYGTNIHSISEMVNLLKKPCSFIEWE